MPAPVVIVHDEAETRVALLRALNEAGYETVGFADPMAALDAVQKDSQVRVLVTRMSFGQGTINGLSLFRMLEFKRAALGPRGASLHAVFIGRADYQDDAEQDGVFLLKPADPHAVVEAVGKQLKPKISAALRMATGPLIREGDRAPLAPVPFSAAVFSQRTDRLLREARLAIGRAVTIQQWRVPMRRPFGVGAA